MNRLEIKYKQAYDNMRKHFGRNFKRWSYWYNTKNKLAEKIRG